MTAQTSFHFVDVFADQPLTGNPVAVVPDADHLTDGQMHAIAREFNQSETTFVMRPDRPDATWRLRSFTPIGAEVFGAGHNALGTWLWLAEDGRLPTDTDDFAQQIGTDLLPVRVTRRPDAPTVVSMDQSPAHFGATVTDRVALADALALTESDLAVDPPAQVVGTGAAHLLVCVRDQRAVDGCAPHAPRLAAILARAGGEGCYVYSWQAGGAYARFFNPTMGIAEDPATGTAAGPLAALLRRTGRLTGDTVAVEQGHALGRPSRIQVTLTGDRVTISGSGLVVASGTLLLPPPTA